MRVVLLIAAALSAVFIHAQSFESVSNELNIVEQYSNGFLGGGVSFCDFDKDGWDDFSFTQNGSSPRFYRNVNGVFSAMNSFMFSEDEMKQITWVDFDNDGDRDLFTTSMNGPFRLLENNGSMEFVDVTIAAGFPWTDYVTFGNSWGDYNRDGFLDVYISTYNGEYFGDPSVTNYLFRNNGDGTFTDATIESGAGNGSNYTFMSLWLDYDNDLWPDLFVINDRLESANYLYHNNGDGTFSDVSAASFMDDYIFSMCNAGDDYDNDGDIDVYVTNSTSGNLMKRNNGDGTFTNYAVQTGTVLNRFTWAAQFIDADNDTWQDLHVCSTPHILVPGENQFLKNESGTFVHYEDEAGIGDDGGWSRSSAMGDINNDGFPDLVVHKSNPNYSSILRNTSSLNNWMKVTLEGVQSNRDGVSSWIECYVEDQKFVRYTYCGESYLSQNSSSEFFGMGQYEMVDSLIVRWTSGIIDKWTNIPVNQSLYLVEGSSESVEIQHNGDLSLCGEESIELYENDWAEYHWSTNETTNSIEVSGEADIWLLTEDLYGNQFLSDTIHIFHYSNTLVTPVLVHPTCHDAADGAIELTGEFFPINNTIHWDTSEVNGFLNENLTGGVYHYNFIDTNFCEYFGEVELIAPYPMVSTVISFDVLCFGTNTGRVEITTQGGNDGYTYDWMSMNPDSLYAGNYSIQISDSVGCLSAVDFTIHKPLQLSAETLTDDALCHGDSTGAVQLTLSGGVGNYAVNTFGMNPDALAAGLYHWILSDANLCSIDIDFEITQPEVITAQITTLPQMEGVSEGSAVVNVIGGIQPYTLAWSNLAGESVDPDYLVAGEYFLTIQDGNFCSSPTFNFNIDFVSEIQEPLTNQTIVYPNPASGSLIVQLGFLSPLLELALTDTQGNLILNVFPTTSIVHLSLKDLSPGLYFLQIKDGVSTSIKKVIVE